MAGSLGENRQCQGLDDEAELPDELWDGPVVKYVAGSHSVTAGQSEGTAGDTTCKERDGSLGMTRSDETVWMDFLDVRLHPRSLYMISNVLHEE